MAGRGTVCLMYHEIELPGRELCDSDPGYAKYAVRLTNFREQMQFLKNSGMPGINVSQMLSSPGNGVALTFDDGCETDLITVTPMLKELGFNATFYITVGFLGKRGFMSKQQARELAQSGMEIGCHSLTHPYLSDLDHAGLQREIVDAKKQLEDITGVSVGHYSCPGGRWDERVVSVATEADYESVATSEIGLNTPEANRYSLSRIAVTREVTFPQFQGLCSGSGLWSKGLKSRGLQIAKRMMGNSAYNRVRSVLLKGS
ncbi:MAG TPA: polysaccharide deacetylase family protein [Terriglobales bacterium]|nr:polysaccharide deacetylase family protein [Terriglobales bacterium]